METPEGEGMNLSGQVWIMMGLLMMMMGININGFDGTIDVYKITRQTVDYLRKQVEKSAETIMLPVFFSKVFSLEGSLGITNEIANEGFELEGLRLESIDEEDLMFEEHVNFYLKY